jgi:hypothetical protein
MHKCKHRYLTASWSRVRASGVTRCHITGPRFRSEDSDFRNTKSKSGVVGDVRARFVRCRGRWASALVALDKAIINQICTAMGGGTLLYICRGGS